MEIDPSQMVLSITKQLLDFRMPGTGIPGFTRHAMRIAKEGIYDVSAFHDKVVIPTLDYWERSQRFWSREDLSDEAKQERQSLHDWLDGLARQARKHKDRLATAKRTSAP